MNSLTASDHREVKLEAFCKAEMDEQWFYVGKKSEDKDVHVILDNYCTQKRDDKAREINLIRLLDMAKDTIRNHNTSLDNNQ